MTMGDPLANTAFHIPVLVDKVLDFLLTDRAGIYVDGTIGGGGHSEAILNRLVEEGRLIGIDRDRDAVAFCKKRFSSYGEKMHIAYGDLSTLDFLLENLGIKQIDGLFLDLGISSHQIGTSERGFSYIEEGPLDMRMDVSVSICAKDIVNTYSEQSLTEIFWTYGEERFARRIARKIGEERRKRPIETTGALSEIVQSVTPYRQRVKTLARIWQAIRFEVNDELGQLKKGLESIYPLLKPEGRIVVLSYESLMDRLVKRFFRGENPTFSKKEPFQSDSQFHFRVLTRRVVRPTEEEVRENPRARSARLRAAAKKLGSLEDLSDEKH